jgi:hypothetical protein
MQKGTGIFCIFLCIATIFMAGCTGTGPANATPVATPTPQIIYVTVFVTPTPEVTPETPGVTPETTAPALSEEAKMDEAFLDYINGNQIFEGMEMLSTASAGSYSINTGYNSGPKSEAIQLTTLLVDAPQPGTQKVKAYRSAMMDALAMMDGSTAGFTRYRDEMQKVILTKNAAEYEMDSLGSSIVDAIRLSGHGDDVKSFNQTETGLKIFSMHHNGDSNFAITLKDEDGKYVALLVNEIGEYSGKNSERLKVGKYYLNIKADGDWTISITSG